MDVMIGRNHSQSVICITRIVRVILIYLNDIVKTIRMFVVRDYNFIDIILFSTLGCYVQYSTCIELF